MKQSILVTLLVVLFGCQQSEPVNILPKNQSQTDAAIASRIEAHMDFLASDFLRGRQTGSQEYNIAASYVATQMQQYGLEPAGSDGSWYQEVPLIKSTLIQESVKLSVNKGADQLNFTFIDDFITPANPISIEDILQGEVVFVGYGIDSQALQYNDYANLDVQGKIVIALRGRPYQFPSEVGAHLASGTTKSETAIKHGAVGFFQIHTPEMENIRKFESYQKYALEPAYHWQDPDGNVAESFPELKGSGYLSTETGAAIFELAGFSLEGVFTDIDNKLNPQGFALNIQLNMERQTQHENLSSPNVVGKLVGSEPLLKQEYVVYSAHLDHIGVESHSEVDDKINNGALDNASGVSVMLETARRFAEQERPKRSILFVAVTAEEKGLLGSSYFATNPTVGADKMVANINLDMPLILYPFGDVIAFGSEHSTLSSAVENAASKNAIKLSPDPMPEQVLFVRSDHYSFVKRGVPSIYLVPGFDSKDPSINGKEVFNLFLEKHYHQPSDDLQLPINYTAAALFTKVNQD
ncbi:MAG: M28 family peptidase, partial [Enterobacterales bacterium]|nr:M28 family peptidase [Enterobacterales bacterium]